MGFCEVGFCELPSDDDGDDANEGGGDSGAADLGFEALSSARTHRHPWHELGSTGMKTTEGDAVRGRSGPFFCKNCNYGKRLWIRN